MLAQALDRRMPGRITALALWLLAIFAVLAGSFTSMVEVRPVCSAHDGGHNCCFSAQHPSCSKARDRHARPPRIRLDRRLATRLLATEAIVKAMGSEQKRYAHSALGKYLPKDIASMILKDPERMSLTGERLPIYTMFTDIQGFTSLSHTIPPENDGLDPQRLSRRDERDCPPAWRNDRQVRRRCGRRVLGCADQPRRRCRSRACGHGRYDEVHRQFRASRRPNVRCSAGPASVFISVRRSSAILGASGGFNIPRLGTQ